jgi:hypothetical protein
VEQSTPLPVPSAAARAWAGVVRAWVWLLGVRPLYVLGLLAIAQWLALVGLVLSIRHNGWLFYQGGDQTFYYTAAWGISGGHVPPSSIGYGWSLLLSPIALFAGPSYLVALPWLVLLQVVVFLPLALVAVYGIGVRVGGRWLGYVAAAGWVVAPYLVIPGFQQNYHEKYVEQFLPQVLGLSGLSDFLSLVAVAVAAWLFLRALEAPDGGSGDAIVAGLVTGFAIGIKPANAPFVAGPALALLVARRWRTGFVYAVAFLPALLTLALWKEKGLGYLPLFGTPGGTRLAAAAGAASVPTGVVAKSLHDYVNIEWNALGNNMAGIREFFWSMRLVEWLPFAGFVAVSRVSWTKAVFLGGWLAAFVVVKGASPSANVEENTFFRLLAPAWPAYLLLGASLPLLVPAIARAVRRAAPEPVRPLAPRSRMVLASCALLGVVPLLVVAGLPRLHNRSIATDFNNNTVVPVGVDFGLRATTNGDRVRLSWRAPAHGSSSTFYRVYALPTFRSLPNLPTPPARPIDGIACTSGHGRAEECSVQMLVLPAGRRTSAVVRLQPAGEWSLRVAQLANWADDPSAGDDLMLSKPVRVHIDS